MSHCRSPLDKVKDIEELKDEIAILREDGNIIVFTNGVFDILHSGHVRYLAEARALGDALVVAINTDSSVKANKGDLRPIVPEDERAELVAALECVDFVVKFDTKTPVSLVGAVQPDIYVKGGDYRAEDLPEAVVVGAYGGQVRILSLVAGRSTTNIVQKIIRNHAASHERAGVEDTK